jgi:hypothetical protein
VADGEVVADGTVWGSAEWYDARWRSVPAEVRQAMVAHLRANIGARGMEQIREAAAADPHRWIHTVGHHGTGTSVRNLLRRAFPDDVLPYAPYPEGKNYKNWDDYYVQALEAAAGARDV